MWGREPALQKHDFYLKKKCPKVLFHLMHLLDRKGDKIFFSFVVNALIKKKI
jgi:hypothetical protein